VTSIVGIFKGVNRESKTRFYNYLGGLKFSSPSPPKTHPQTAIIVFL